MFGSWGGRLILPFHPEDHDIIVRTVRYERGQQMINQALRRKGHRGCRTQPVNAVCYQFVTTFDQAVRVGKEGHAFRYGNGPTGVVVMVGPMGGPTSVAMTSPRPLAMSMGLTCPALASVTVRARLSHSPQRTVAKWPCSVIWIRRPRRFNTLAARDPRRHRHLWQNEVKP